MTRTTTLAALLAAGMGLSACMSNDTAMSEQSQLATGATNTEDEVSTGDVVSSPTDGIEDNPDL